jgi:hypothetical protein
MKNLTLGTRVHSGKPGTEDYDTGIIADPNDFDLRIPHRPTDVFVAWDSGVRTWTRAEDIRQTEEDK